MVGEKGLSDVLSVNINGDLEDRKIVRIAKRFKAVWVGCNPLFKDPFYVADIIADYVDFVGFGVVTVDFGCEEILRKFRNLVKEHKDTTFALGIGSGKLRGHFGLKAVLNCLKFLRNEVDLLFCGCSGPNITSEASKIVDGILFNYAHPEHLNWIVGFLKRKVYKVAYAPSLILPSDFEMDLLIACAMVSCSNKSFVKTFKYDDMCREFSKLDFLRVIVDRKRLNVIPDEIKRYREVLIDRFAIAGNVERFTQRLREILKICDHVVLGDPFFRDPNSVKQFEKILMSLK
jgi:5,10-methylenetetrahydromethanopterin reductase